MKKWLLENLISIFALMLSSYTLFYTYQYNKETESIAKKALTISEESNKLQQGYFSKFPIITINNYKEKNNIINNNILIYFHNDSEITIRGFEIQIYPLSGLIYQKEPIYQEIQNLKKTTYKFYFSQLLTKNGYGQINIAPFLMRNLFESKNKFKNTSNLHTGLFNILINPIRLGQEQSEDTLYYGGKNRILIDIDFIPKKIFTLDIEQLLKTSIQDINIYGGSN